MAYLFEVVNKIVVPTDEVLQVPPFKEIWERDKSPKKEVAIQEFTYMEFMTSSLATNPYKDYSEDKKESVIRKDVIKEKNWKPDKLIEEGMEKIITLQTEGSSTYSLYMSAIKAKDKLESFFNNFDMEEKNERSGNPIYKPRDITIAIQDLDKTIMSLKSLEKKVEEDLFEVAKIRGQKKISDFANPDTINRLKRQ